MDLPADTLILIAVVIVAAVVAFLELRYIRTRKHVKVDQYLEQDDAYNAVTTTRAVATSLSRNGRDTSEADALIYQAEAAYDRREFVRCMELADRAKVLLKNCKEKDLLAAPVVTTEKASGPKDDVKGEESVVVPANEARKLPPNYLESKFLLDTVSSLIEEAQGEKREEAQKDFDLARSRFEEGDYSEALKGALKAKRLLAPAAPARDKATSASMIIKPQAPTKEEGRRCPKCGMQLGPNDDFCFSCGTKAGMRICHGCQTMATSDDMFCRKCGCRIDQ